MEGCGFYFEGIMVGYDAKERDGKISYNVLCTDGKSNTWRIKLPVPPVSSFGEIIRIKIENINTFKDRVYYSGSEFREIPE